MITELHQSGQLDCLGQMWTWVSGTAAAPVVVDGPFFVKASQHHTPGSVAAQEHTAGSVSSQNA